MNDCNRPCSAADGDAVEIFTVAEGRRGQALQFARELSRHGESTADVLERAAQFEAYLAGQRYVCAAPPDEQGEHRTLSRVIADLYASEINCGVSTFWDGGLQAWIGDPMNGYRARESFFPVPHDREAMLRRAAKWLHGQAVEHFPDSAYALRFAVRAA